MDCKLINLGFSQRYLQEAALYKDLFLARVISQYKDLYKVSTGKAELTAEISGKLRFSAVVASNFPAVGDFVMIDRKEDSSGNAIIHHILKRQSVFERKAAGTDRESQIVAVNIDTVFICMALNNDYNLRRLERYLSIAWSSGALPVVVLTKADLCPDIEGRLTEVAAVAAGVEILVTTSLTQDGYSSIVKFINPGKTVAFIGSSGVGKSTLINLLLGEEQVETRATRNDDKGRHTTSRRELIIIPSGGAVIDTPGMRELGLESADLGKAFADIEELAVNCRFSDCTHSSEPHCAVRRSIEIGELSEKRLESFLKLKKEARYEGLNAKQIEKEKLNDMFAGFGGVKNARNFIKNKHKPPRS